MDLWASDVMPETSRARHGNALRAGVLGSTDGLVSNLSLVMGVAGSGAPHEAIIVGGLAGLACAFSIDPGAGNEPAHRTHSPTQTGGRHNG